MEVQRKLDVIELADRLGNATEAARITVCSSRSIYNYQKLLAEEGILGLKRINKPLYRSKNRIPEDTEHKIIELTLNNPYQTSVQLRTMLKKEYNITVSSCTIRNIWKREALNTRALRI